MGNGTPDDQLSVPLRVAIADDHPLFLEGVIAALGRSPDITIVGTAGDAAGAVRLVREARPDIVLLDLTMPGDGLQATREIAASCPETKVLILTVLESEDKLVAALQAGAAGYALKGMRGRESRPQSYLGSSALTPVRRWQIWRKHWPTTIRKFAIALPRRFPPWVSWQRLQFLR